MKKTFKLHIEGKNSDRLLDAIKHEVRKYVKREKRKVLPAGANYWAFDCKFGTSADAAEVLHLGEITKQMDAVAKNGGDSFYVEILARPAVRTPREREEAAEDSDDSDFDD
ncbi:MAG: hypothetical protein EOO52_18335 [Gammaproteobacteria bacterium]|nr:MAG: hypothetical protein EOO52_18335 [Gammaproteobacteria bacterium]